MEIVYRSCSVFFRAGGLLQKTGSIYDASFISSTLSEIPDMGLILTRETLQDAIGTTIGESPWVEITQENVNKFADITLDPQYIHVDPERAAQTPFGGTIAHGFLSLSMLSYFAASGAGVGVEGMTMGLNYGFEKVRFLNPVRVGKKIRGRSVLLSAEETKPGQFRFSQEVTVEIDGEKKPALIAEWITMAIVTAVV